MSELTVTKVLESESELSKDMIITKISDAFKKEFDNVKLKSDKNGESELYCRVKTKLFNPIVSIKGPIKVQTKGKKAKVLIDADTKTNGWFWVTLLLGMLFWPLWVMMFFMYRSQKRSSINSFEKVFERMEFDLSGI